MLSCISYCWYLPWVHPNHPSSGSCFESHKSLYLNFFHVFYSWIMCVCLQTCFPYLLLFAVRSASSSSTLESELNSHQESIRVTVQSYQQHLEEVLGKLRDSNVAFLKSCRYTDFMEVYKVVYKYWPSSGNWCLLHGQNSKIKVYFVFHLVSYLKK